MVCGEGGGRGVQLDSEALQCVKLILTFVSKQRSQLFSCHCTGGDCLDALANRKAKALGKLFGKLSLVVLVCTITHCTLYNLVVHAQLHIAQLASPNFLKSCHWWYAAQMHIVQLVSPRGPFLKVVNRGMHNCTIAQLHNCTLHIVHCTLHIAHCTTCVTKRSSQD